MDYIRGGRSKQAPYSTTHARIPEDTKAVVEQISWGYRQLFESEHDPKAVKFLKRVKNFVAEALDVFDKPVNNKVSSEAYLKVLNENQQMRGQLDSIYAILADAKERSRSTRNWVEANRLLDMIESSVSPKPVNNNQEESKYHQLDLFENKE